MSEERKRKKKKGKDDESILENEIFHIMEVSLKEALDMCYTLRCIFNLFYRIHNVFYILVNAAYN